MHESPYYSPGESGLYGNRLPHLSTGDSVSADRQLSIKSANALVPQSTTQNNYPANAGSTSSSGNLDGAKTPVSHRDNADSQPLAPVASHETFYPGCIHMKVDSNTIALWHPDAQKREPISVAPKAETLQPTTPGSRVQAYPGYYQQLGIIPIKDNSHPNTTLCWDLNSTEGEYTKLTSNAEDGPPTSSKENHPHSLSPSISSTTNDAYASTCPIRRSCPTSPISPKRTRLRAQLASARQRRKSLDCDIARLSTALGFEEPHECGEWAALKGRLESQLQAAQRQREGLVARGGKTEALDVKIEVLREALGETDGEGEGIKRRRMNEGILMGRIVKREVIGEPKREG